MVVDIQSSDIDKVETKAFSAPHDDGNNFR
jgi:hypothetical protein